jgi:hypothetical protein
VSCRGPAGRSSAMLEADIISTRRVLGLRDQPLRKNEKVGVGRAQIVLSEEQAAKIYSLRCTSKAMHSLLQQVRQDPESFSTVCFNKPC